MSTWFSCACVGVGVFALGLFGCTDDVPADADAWPVVTVTIAEATQFAEEDTLVSLTGRVAAQDSTGLRLTLVDGSGAIRVVLPDPLPPLDDVTIGVRGAVQTHEGSMAVRALEWTFDSTLAD